MPYISVNHSLKIDFSAHSFSERFTENRILLLHFQWIHSLKIDSSAQSFSESFTENSFYVVTVCACHTEIKGYLLTHLLYSLYYPCTVMGLYCSNLGSPLRALPNRHPNLGPPLMPASSVEACWRRWIRWIRWLPLILTSVLGSD